MREYNCGSISNQETNNYFTIREYEYCSNELIFRDYNIREIITIKEI